MQILLYSLYVTVVMTEPVKPLSQHKILLRQFSMGDEKLHKRQPIKSNDESE